MAGRAGGRSGARVQFRGLRGAAAAAGADRAGPARPCPGLSLPLVWLPRPRADRLASPVGLCFHRIGLLTSASTFNAARVHNQRRAGG